MEKINDKQFYDFQTLLHKIYLKSYKNTDTEGETHIYSFLLEALILYFDPMLIILLMVELPSTRAREEKAVLNGNSLKLGHVRHGGSPPWITLVRFVIFSFRVSVMEECFSFFATFVSA